MRLTKEEIREKYGTYYDGFRRLGDTVKIYYGDEPAFRWRVNDEKNTVNPYSNKTWESSDIAKKYILSQEGDFDEYNFYNGYALIKLDGTLIFGKISFPYGNKSSYNNVEISIANCYGIKEIEIFQMNGKHNYMGNYNYGKKSICYSQYSEDFDKDKLDKIMNFDNNPKAKDWGYAQKKVMETLRELDKELYR